MHHDITVKDERHGFRLQTLGTQRSHKCPSICRFLNLAQVQFSDVRRAEGAQVQTPIILVDLADVGRHQAVGVVEAPRADAAVMELRHQAVPRDELHQHLLTEELERREEGGEEVKK